MRYAPDDVQRAVFVQPRLIAGVIEPHILSVDDQFAEAQQRFLGPVYIPGAEHARPLEMQLAGGAGRAGLVGLVQNDRAQMLHRHAHGHGATAAGRGQVRHADVMGLADAVEVPQGGLRHLAQGGCDQIVADHLSVQHHTAERELCTGLGADGGQECLVEGRGEQHLVDAVADQEIGKPARRHKGAGLGEPELGAAAQGAEHFPNRKDVDANTHAGGVGRIGVAPCVGQIGRILCHGDALGPSRGARCCHQIDCVLRGNGGG